MPAPETLAEARRVMTLCNACRYCEGFCAVFQAMELRTVFADDDLNYLANLCHDCRGCWYACQYAPPHPFDINVPRVLADLRLQTYRDLARPRALGSLFRRPGRVAFAAVAGATLAVLGTVLWGPGPDVLTRSHVGPGSFYAVVPYAVMVGMGSALGLLVLAAWLLSIRAAGWLRDTGGVRPLIAATLDAARLTYLGGGGEGCPYPEERNSRRRRVFHHLVFWGFLTDFAATTVAAFYHHVLGLDAPYAWTSLPVVLGSAGGVGLLLGTAGLLALRRGADPDPAFPPARALDTPFLVLLGLTALTGFAVLFGRETAAMGALLVVHLGVVFGLFVTLPYGKLVHAVHRFGALVRWNGERGRR